MSVPIIVLPGASLMDIRPRSWGVEVRCPGCGNTQFFTTSGAATFVHEDGCEIYSRIRAALLQRVQ